MHRFLKIEAVLVKKGNVFIYLLFTRQIKITFCLFVFFSTEKAFLLKSPGFELHKVYRFGVSMPQFVSLVDYLISFNISENLIFLVLLFFFCLLVVISCLA